MASALLALPRELRQDVLYRTFSFTTAPFKAYYRIDVIEELIDRFYAMRAWSNNLRRVNKLFNEDIAYVVKQWEKEYHQLLNDFSNALIGTNTCWLSKFDASPTLSFLAVIQHSTVAVRPPVFGWDRPVERYVVYEDAAARWKKAGWAKGTKLRTMKQGQRSRGGTISYTTDAQWLNRLIPNYVPPCICPLILAPASPVGPVPRYVKRKEREEVDGEEIERDVAPAAPKKRTDNAKETGLSQPVTKASGIFGAK